MLLHGTLHACVDWQLFMNDNVNWLLFMNG